MCFMVRRPLFNRRLARRSMTRFGSSTGMTGHSHSAVPRCAISYNIASDFTAHNNGAVAVQVRRGVAVVDSTIRIRRHRNEYYEQLAMAIIVFTCLIHICRFADGTCSPRKNPRVIATPTPLVSYLSK